VAQSLSAIYIHLVFSAKHREPLLLQPLRGQMHAYLATVLKNQDCPAVKVGGTSDHIHSLFRMSKTRTLAQVLEEIKTSSSRWIKTQSRALGGFHWQNGYGAFSVSRTEVDEVARYIEDQEAYHTAVSFQDEYRRYLETYGVDYDERYVWD